MHPGSPGEPGWGHFGVAHASPCHPFSHTHTGWRLSGATQAPWTQVPLGPGQKKTPQSSPFHPGRHEHLPVPVLVPCPSQFPWPLHVSAGAVPARGGGRGVALRCGVGVGVVRCSAVQSEAGRVREGV
jgi:hypothetical protein